MTLLNANPFSSPFQESFLPNANPLSFHVMSIPGMSTSPTRIPFISIPKKTCFPKKKTSYLKTKVSVYSEFQSQNVHGPWSSPEDMLEDAKGLPQPKAPSNPIPSDRAPLDAELMHATNTAYELEEPRGRMELLDGLVFLHL